MMRFLFNLAQLFVIYWVTCKVLKYTVFRRFNKRRGKYGKKRLSIIGKIWVLFSRHLHSMVDGLLTKQSMYLKAKREQSKSLVKQNGDNAQQDSNEKVIQFSKYQSKIVR